MRKRRRFRELDIRAQMKAVAAAVLAMFVLLCALISLSVKQLVRRNEDEHMQVTALRLHDRIELTYETLENYCMYIGEDRAVREFLRSGWSELYATLDGAVECLTRYKVLEPMIEDISLVNDTVHYSKVFTAAELDSIRAETGGAPFCWLGIMRHSFAIDGDKPDMLVFAGDITAGEGNIGTVVFSVDPACFLENREAAPEQMFFLADDSGAVCLGGQVSPGEALGEWEAGGRPDRMSRGDRILRASPIGRPESTLVSVLDLRRARTGVTQTEILIWGCVFQAAVFCLAFFFIISRGIVSPLHQFRGVIRHIRVSRRNGLEGELELRGCAEITELGREFSGMLSDIERLNRQVNQSAADLYELKVRTQRAELAFLRSQVDPHFLYNTLEVLRKSALEKDAPELAQMALDMGNIFRYNAKGGDEVLVEEELSIVLSYIHIQQVRFSGRFSVYTFVPEDVRGLRIMKMLLQPIVENAIVHGIEPKSGRGSLYIGARREGQVLVISVKDDGVGIEGEKLKELRRALASETADTSDHVGLLNTCARIRLCYGREYGIDVDSRAGDGTTVVMRLPARPE